MTQQTVNVVDAMNERVAIEDERIERAKRRLDEISGAIARNQLGFGGWTAIGYFSCAVAIFLVAISMLAKVAAPAFLGALGLAYGMNRIGAAKERETELQKLREEASTVRTQMDKAQADRERLIEEKREILLRHDLRLRSEPEPSSPMASPAPSVGVPSVVASDTIDCPRCAETIKARAKVCRYCGHELASAS